MRPIRQLLRQPMRCIAGIVLIALAVAVLAVCLGQSLAAKHTEAQLEYEFTTIALATSNYNYKKSKTSQINGSTTYMNKEVAAWVEQVIAEHPELVETVSTPGLASAYIPELQADHYCNYDYRPYYGKVYGTMNSNVNRLLATPKYMRYCSNWDTAMLTVTLESIGQVEEIYQTKRLTNKETVRLLEMYRITLEARIDQVVSLAEQFSDPTGWPITLTLDIPCTQKAEDLQLEVGEQYLVYGIDYFSNQMKLQEWVEMARNAVGEGQLHMLTPEEKELYLQTHPLVEVAPAAYYGDNFEAVLGLAESNGKVGLVLPQKTWESYQCATMSLYDYAAMPKFSNDDGSLIQTRSTYVGDELREISWQEYMEYYSIPTIAKLEGSVQDFLAKNSRWSSALTSAQVDSHAFPIIGVEKLDYIADFNRGLARISQGRDFTKAELESGAKVCVISETLAQINGLSVGDSINPQFYSFDKGVPYQSYITAGKNVVLPNAYYYTGSAAFTGEPEVYTIIGIYRQDNVWEDVYFNNYAFTPNTIFVPHASVTAPMDYGDLGMFRTIVLKNGCAMDFDELVMDKEFETILVDNPKPEMFVYYDQGYLTVRDSIASYASISRQVLVVGFVVYAILILLFLLLYPLRQGKTLRTMANFGAPRKDKIRYVLLSALGILLPGTVLGAALGATLWGVVIGRLLTVSSALFSLTLDFSTLALISLAQLVLAMLLVALLAIPMTRHCNLMKRK